MESPSIGLRVAIVNSRSKEPRGCWTMPLPVRSRGVAAPWRRARRERRSLKTLHARNLFLSQCLSAKAEKAVVWNHQLPEWRQKSLSRLRDCYTADPVPNSKKWERKWRSWRGTEEGDVSRQCAIADLDSGGHLQRLWTKLATFVPTTAAPNEVLPICSGCKEPLGSRPVQYTEVIAVPGSSWGARSATRATERSEWVCVFVLPW